MSKRTVMAPEAKYEKKVDLQEQDEDVRVKIAANKRALQTYENKKQLLYPIEKIAQDKLIILNVKYPGADEDYPHVQHALFRFVSKVFPNAVGGPLYVDEPRNPNEIHRAYDRHEKMKERNLRHVVVEKDTTFEHMLEQLGEM